ncbi:MAG: hypothetical protein VXY90_10365, partial [Pseudomonadota bacterium]|nr:hypothetical protein [Pseudomonadota bacterium]
MPRRVAFDAPLTLGAVNRAAESSSGVGGKGQGAYLAAAANVSVDVLALSLVPSSVAEPAPPDVTFTTTLATTAAAFGPAAQADYKARLAALLPGVSAAD